MSDPALPAAPQDNFGDRVRFARELRCMSRRQLARAIHRDEGMIGKIELGQVRVMLPDTVRKIEFALDVKDEWLQTGNPAFAPVPWPERKRYKPRDPEKKLAITNQFKLPNQVPLAIVRLLCRGTLGPVSDAELNGLIQFYNQYHREGITSENTLELELWAIRFSLAETGEPKSLAAEAFTAAVKRMRSETPAEPDNENA